MATALQPGTVEKTTTFKQVVPAEEANNRGKRIPRPGIWDFLPTISLEDWKSGRFQVYLYRYNPLTEKKMVLEKFNEALDPFSVKYKFGGGTFNIMVKDGPELIYDQDFDIEGDPIVNGSGKRATAEPETGSTTDMLIRELLQEIRLSRGGSLAADSMKQAMALNAEALKMGVEGARSVIPTPATPSNPMDDLFKQFMAAAIQKMLNPPETNSFKDTLSLINEIKTAGFLGGAPKADLASTFVASLPSLLDRAVNGLHEVRLHSEATERAMRLQRGEIKPDDPNVITIDGKTEARQPNPAPTAPPQPTGILTPEVTQQVIMQADLTRLVNAIKDPECTGQDIYTFLSCVWPELLAEMVKFKKEDLLMFFRSREMQMSQLHNAILLEVGNDPRLPKMIEEFLAIAKADAAPPSATV